MNLEDKERIEKQAINYVIQETGYQVLPEHDNWKKAYIAGATSERERKDDDWNAAIDACIKNVFLMEHCSALTLASKLESLKK
jgi:hypothetical protein